VNSAFWHPRFVFSLWIYSELCVVAPQIRVFSADLMRLALGGHIKFALLFRFPSDSCIHGALRAQQIHVFAEIIQLFQQSTRRGPRESPGVLCRNSNAKLASINSTPPRSRTVPDFVSRSRSFLIHQIFVHIQTPDLPLHGAATRISYCHNSHFL
jgi:hypothetical protein